MTWTGDERRADGDLRERVAVLEANHAGMTEKLDTAISQQTEILKELTRYKGFIGGVVFVVSGAVVLWNLFGDWLKSHWG